MIRKAGSVRKDMDLCYLLKKKDQTDLVLLFGSQTECLADSKYSLAAVMMSIQNTAEDWAEPCGHASVTCTEVTADMAIPCLTPKAQSPGRSLGRHGLLGAKGNES